MTVLDYDQRNPWKKWPYSILNPHIQNSCLHPSPSFIFPLLWIISALFFRPHFTGSSLYILIPGVSYLFWLILLFLIQSTQVLSSGELHSYSKLFWNPSTLTCMCSISRDSIITVLPSRTFPALHTLAHGHTHTHQHTHVQRDPDRAATYNWIASTQ